MSFNALKEPKEQRQVRGWSSISLAEEWKDRKFVALRDCKKNTYIQDTSLIVLF